MDNKMHLTEIGCMSRKFPIWTEFMLSFFVSIVGQLLMHEERKFLHFSQSQKDPSRRKRRENATLKINDKNKILISANIILNRIRTRASSIFLKPSIKKYTKIAHPTISNQYSTQKNLTTAANSTKS